MYIIYDAYVLVKFCIEVVKLDNRYGIMAVRSKVDIQSAISTFERSGFYEAL